MKNLKLKSVDKLVIGHLNINSLRYKFEQFKIIVGNHLDIIVITETKLDISFPTSQFLLEGYCEPYRKDRTGEGGGILIYVREDIPSKPLNKHHFPDDIEGLFIEINLRKVKWLLLGSYHPPSQTDDYYYRNLEKAVDIYAKFYDKFLFAGDFNNEETEPCLSEFLHQYEAVNIVKEKTCFKNPENPSCIDLFITNSASSFQNTSAVSTGLSDFHKMTVTVLKNTFPKAEPKEIIYRNYKRFSSERFKEELRNTLQNANIIDYSHFEKIFLDILNVHAPVKKKKLRANETPYMTKALRKAIMKRSELETKFRKKYSIVAEAAFKKQKNFVSRLYKKERKKFYSSLKISDINDGKKFWKTMKPLFSDKGTKIQKITIVEKDEIISSRDGVAQTLNNFFQNAVKSLDIEGNAYLTNIPKSDDAVDAAIEKFECHPSIRQIKERVNPQAFSFDPVLLEQVKEELSNLDPKKANGLNCIPAKHLKECADECGSVLTNLINSCIADNVFPSKLKMADVTPIHKEGDATAAKNYRPVSVLPAASKVYERILQKQMSSHIDKYLSPYLCGYRKGYSAQYALVSLLERWKLCLDRGGYGGAVLMDLSKAFDTINHELLIAKLHAYGFGKTSLKLIFSYLTNRFQRTKIENVFSSWSELLQGVPQGSILGPLLFNIYINDLLWINSETEVCNYADDTTLYACDQSLESVLLRLEHDCLLAIEWFDNNYMKLNSDKCHLLIAGFKHQNHWLNVGGSKIWEKHHKKLLGLTIDRELSFDLHVSNLCKNANRKLSALGRISNYMSLYQRRTLFKSFIESQFNYCPLAWMFHHRHTNRKINRLHERALRMVYSDDTSTFEDLLNKDGSVTIHQKNLQLLAIEMYKLKNGLSTKCFENICEFGMNKGFNFRVQYDFQIPACRTVQNGDHSIRHLGPQIWHSIPTEIKNASSLEVFKDNIKNWKPLLCPCRLCKLYVQGVGYIS